MHSAEHILRVISLFDNSAAEKGSQPDVKKNHADTIGIGERAGGILFSQWNEFCDLKERVLRQGDIDSIHDLRVVSRRIRSTVGLFAPYIAGRAVRQITKRLRRVTRELGRLRNIDEAVIYFGAMPVSLPAVRAALPAARVQEMKAVTDLLESFPREEMDRMLREAVSGLAGIPPDDNVLQVYLSDTSLERYQAVYDLLVPATIPENAEMRHRLRIAIKKWRYLLETLGQVSRQDYSSALEALKEYQTLLGSLNDMVEFAALCADLSLPRHERDEIASALGRDSAANLARFIEKASTRPLQYTFTL
jgi:CHAD domain-containing protein